MNEHEDFDAWYKANWTGEKRELYRNTMVYDLMLASFKAGRASQPAAPQAQPHKVIHNDDGSTSKHYKLCTGACAQPATPAYVTGIDYGDTDRTVEFVQPAAPAVPQQHLQINLDEAQAELLRDYIGEGDRPITLLVADGSAGFGLYAFDTEYPDEGGEFIAAAPKEQTP